LIYNHQSHDIKDPVRAIVDMLEQRMEKGTSPSVISIDGGSGAGKSVISAEVAASTGATIIHCDDFFNNTISDADWDAYSIKKRCRLCFDWERLRNEALLPLLAGQKVTYCPYYALDMNDSSKAVVKEPSHIIILDGIYSSYWLERFVDFKILVDVSPDVRYKRHNLREGTEDTDWHLRWDPVEDYYFSALCPSDTFDKIVVNE